MHYVHQVSSHFPPLDGVDASDTMDTVEYKVILLHFISLQSYWGKPIMIWTLAEKEGNANSCATAKNSNIMYNISVVVVLLCVLYEVCNICTGIHNESF